MVSLGSPDKVRLDTDNLEMQASIQLNIEEEERKSKKDHVSYSEFLQKLKRFNPFLPNSIMERLYSDMDFGNLFYH